MGGMYADPVDGKLVDGKYVFQVPVPGRFDLAFETAGGRFEGWDTAVARSDYEEEQPLSDESKKIILAKMGSETVSGFPDEAWVLDIQGNIQHAATLLYGLRTSTWTESMGDNDRQWISRVDRWEWESPDDDTWTTYKETPYYALHRQRIAKGAQINITYARALGGIVLTPEKPNIDAGILKLPKITPGIHAMNPDGTLTEPIKVKPKPAGVPKEKNPIRKQNTEDIETQPSPKKKNSKPSEKTAPTPATESPTSSPADSKSDSKKEP